MRGCILALQLWAFTVYLHTFKNQDNKMPIYQFAKLQLTPCLKKSRGVPISIMTSVCEKAGLVEEDPWRSIILPEC